MQVVQQITTCPNCGTRADGNQFCTSCGAKLPIVEQRRVWESQATPSAPTVTREAVPPRKYGALKAVATIYRIIGWVVMMGGTLFSIALAVIAAQGAEGLGGFMPWGAGIGMVGVAIAGVIISILSGLFLLAFADLCCVLIDIEENTRLKE